MKFFKSKSKKNLKQRSKNEEKIKKAVEKSKKDPNFFKEIIDFYQRPLFGFINKLYYFSKEDIEDILQEVFIKVYKNLNDYDPNYDFSPWIYRITRNQALDALKSKKTKPKTQSIDDEEFAITLTSKIDLEKEVIEKENMEKIMKIIKNLPVKYREVLYLRLVMNKNYEEIMDILKKPKGTVSSLLRRGKIILKQKIRNEILKV